MAHLSSKARDAYRRNASAIEKAMQAGISRGRQTATKAYQQIWNGFCLEYQLDAHLSGVEPADRIIWIQQFAEQVRSGQSSASKNPVRSSTVADALNSVAQAFTFMGLDDPRFRPGTNNLDPRLARQLKGYANTDAPPMRVRPIPIQILHRATSLAMAENSETIRAASDLMWIAFFFLLRPGEYTQPAEDSHPFRIRDVRLFVGETLIDHQSGDLAVLDTCTFVSLTFSTQKNGTRGESIGHGHSNNPLACPVRAVASRIRYLRSVNAPSDTPLCAIGPQLLLMSSAPVTLLLRQACAAEGNPAGFLQSHITAKSLRSTGAMALLNKRVEHTKIQMMGRWKLDAIFRYLHVQAHCLMSDFSNLMLQGGQFDLIPNDTTAHLPTDL